VPSLRQFPPKGGAQVTIFRGLHDYQQEVADGAGKLWKAGYRRIAAVMATGAGKTFTFSVVARMALAAGVPVLVLAHRKELLTQATNALKIVNPDARVGLLKGAVKQYRADVVVGSIQTASTPHTLALLKTRNWGLVIVDECHHSTADTYVRVLRELGAYAEDGSGPLVLGVTATLDRADGAALGQIFEQVIEPQVGLMDLIRRGYLVPPRGVRVKIEDLNLDKIKRVAGDFNSGALGRAMSDAMAPKRIVESYLEHCPDAPAVAFLPTVAMSIEQAQTFNDAGIVAVHLDGTTPDDVRDAALADFRAGRVRVLCNVGLFLEGTDLPMIQCVILGRPTSSPTVYVQQVGRGLRLHAESGKKFCWVLDVCGVTTRHRLATMANLSGADRPEDVPDELLMYEEDLLPEADDLPPEDTEPDEPEPTVYADGDVTHELIDLFGESKTAWLRTRGGSWFVPAGSAGFLYLSPATYEDDAGRREFGYELCGVTHQGDRHTLTALLDLPLAMAAGDAMVAANPIWQAGRDEAWRSQLARGLRGQTKGEVWDARSIDAASRVIDR
jgi:superfamily II DNA or RNA helicase